MQHNLYIYVYFSAFADVIWIVTQPQEYGAFSLSRNKTTKSKPIPRIKSRNCEIVIEDK